MRTDMIMKDWFLTRTRELIHALAGIAEYCNTIPNYHDEDDHGHPTREAILADYLAIAVRRATQILAYEADVDWKARDSYSILHQGQAGFRHVLTHYGLALPWEHPPSAAFTMPQTTPKPLGSLDGLAEHWTFTTFNIARPLQGPITWDETIFDEHQQREMLTQALEQTYRYAVHPQGWLLIVGPYGVGKSHLASAVIWEALKSGIAPLYLSALDITNRYRSLDDPEWLREQPRLETADLLVLDSLYLEDRFVWNRYIEQLLRARHRGLFPTVLVSTRGQENLPAWLSNIVTQVSVVASDYRQLRSHS